MSVRARGSDEAWVAAFLWPSLGPAGALLHAREDTVWPYRSTFLSLSWEPPSSLSLLLTQSLLCRV